MNPIHVPRHYSRNVLIRMLILAAVAAGLIVWQSNFLINVYFRNQLTTVGWGINGGIVVAFALALLKLILILVKYAGEERALARFVINLRGEDEPDTGINPDSMIAVRYGILRELHARGATINQGALSATVVAQTSTDASFPKFITNILILTGVLGTIVSLSIALIGASGMLGSGDVSEMGTVIHGMSTALSTTMTAILCYLFLGYFYLKLTDVQTRLLGALEQITTTVLMPRFQPPAETLGNQFADMLRATRDLLGRLQQSHGDFAAVADKLSDTVEMQRDQLRAVTDSVADIKRVLRQGFRLPEGEP